MRRRYPLRPCKDFASPAGRREIAFTIRFLVTISCFFKNLIACFEYRTSKSCLHRKFKHVLCQKPCIYGTVYQFPQIQGLLFSGDNRARTCDLLHVKQTLSQLSYVSATKNSITESGEKCKSKFSDFVNIL